ncbi:MAG TPA: carboxypeptidase-like regulatory domain-containing protein, partial [Terriglobales bacterium]|nr:carboxypeptidase-like regulatory domain-containing protein [Terriglobales bacterium]
MIRQIARFWTLSLSCESINQTPQPVRSLKRLSAVTGGAQFTTLILLLVLNAIATFGQSTATGTVSGQVLDPTSAVVVGATVTLTDTSTGTAHTTTTNDSGRYLFVNV